MAEAEEENVQGNPIAPLIFKLLPFIAAFLVGVLGAAYVAKQKPEVLGLSKGAAQVQAETDALVAEVGKLIDLPKDEKPTVATVTDIDKVKDQPFFKNAKNGDKVLIYTNAKKAILYRPSEKRIIEVGAVNLNQESPSPSPSSTPEAKEIPKPTESAKP